MQTQPTFQLAIKRLFFFQTSSTLWSIPTNQPQHILLKNDYKSHHSNTYHSYFYHLFTKLLLHHNSDTTNSISFSKPLQLISPSLHPKHPSTLSSQSNLLQTMHINHHLYLFFTKVSTFSLWLLKFHIPTLTSKRSSDLPPYYKQNMNSPGCGVTPSYSWKAGVVHTNLQVSGHPQ